MEGGHREDGVVLPASDLRVRDRGLVVVSLRRGVDVGGVVGVEGDEPVLRADVLKGENLKLRLELGYNNLNKNPDA